MFLSHHLSQVRAGGLASVAALSLLLGACVTHAAPIEPPLSANDISWLFPPPKSTLNLSSLIAINNLTVPDPVHPGARVPVWSNADFANFLALADSPQAQAGVGARITLPAAVRTKAVWFVAGVRIDAGAPGLDPSITNVFGQRPQIRLILQPVLPTGPGGAPAVQDITAHLIFDFVLPEPRDPNRCFLHAKPDLTALSSIVADAATLRDSLARGQFGHVSVTTAGLPLGVHPGLSNTATRPFVTQEMQSLLLKHLAPTRLNSMAIMGLPSPAPAPWIFLSMLRQPTGQFAPVPGPTLDGTQFAMMLTPLGQTPRVVPTPHTNNLNPITCAMAFGPTPLPVALRQGRATADFFDDVSPSSTTVKPVVDLIADPTRSHFFNTDCVSCHTETRRAMEVNLPSPPGLSPSVMPNGPYNVRNFGWSPSIEGPIQATATRRAAAETASVVSWINANIIGK